MSVTAASSHCASTCPRHWKTRSETPTSRFVARNSHRNPKTLPKVSRAFSFAAETELLGADEVKLVWEQKIDELGIGKSQEIAIPRLVPAEVDLAIGQIVISKSESLDVQRTEGWEGLIPIDLTTTSAGRLRSTTQPWLSALSANGRSRSAQRVTNRKQAN